MNRLEQLKRLRAQIDAEIEREHAAMIRQRELRQTAIVAITRGSWSNRVFAAACDHFNVTGDAVLGHSRETYVMNARHVAMWLMRDAGRSSTEVGREMERDHSTVLNAVRRVNESPALLAVAHEIRAVLTGAREATA